jgi:hypothetical protein
MGQTQSTETNDNLVEPSLPLSKVRAMLDDLYDQHKDDIEQRYGQGAEASEQLLTV